MTITLNLQFLAGVGAYLTMTAMMYGIDRIFHDGEWLPKVSRRQSLAFAVGFPLLMVGCIAALAIPVTLSMYATGSL